jgi:hypothetical protein
MHQPATTFMTTSNSMDISFVGLESINDGHVHWRGDIVGIERGVTAAISNRKIYL